MALTNRLQIRQPPITPSRLYAREPFALRVKQNNSQDPENVNNQQVETDARRSAIQQAAAIKHPTDRFAGDVMQAHGDQVRGIPLQDVKEKRHAPKRNEEATDFIHQRAAVRGHLV